MSILGIVIHIVSFKSELSKLHFIGNYFVNLQLKKPGLVCQGSVQSVHLMKRRDLFSALANLWHCKSLKCTVLNSFGLCFTGL